MDSGSWCQSRKTIKTSQHQKQYSLLCHFIFYVSIGNVFFTSGLLDLHFSCLNTIIILILFSKSDGNIFAFQWTWDSL